jgi:aryl-alcohol dehydrogenase-like predicted oxidoreductase
VRDGKVRYIGSSTYPAHEMVEAQYVARERGRERFVTEQPPYSLLVRGIERDVLPVAKSAGMGVIPWSPLAGGWLSGKWRKGAADLTSRRSAMIPQRYDMSVPDNQRKLDAADALGALADESGISLIHMAIAFVANHPAVTAPIIGPRTMEQLEGQLGAVDVVLSEDILDRIDEIVPPGATISASDYGYEPPSLAEPARRRRRH